jgi:hypothetical protein
MDERGIQVANTEAGDHSNGSHENNPHEITHELPKVAFSPIEQAIEVQDTTLHVRWDVIMGRFIHCYHESSSTPSISTYLQSDRYSQAQKLLLIKTHLLLLDTVVSMTIVKPAPDFSKSEAYLTLCDAVVSTCSDELVLQQLSGKLLGKELHSSCSIGDFPHDWKKIDDISYLLMWQPLENIEKDYDQRVNCVQNLYNLIEGSGHDLKQVITIAVNHVYRQVSDSSFISLLL